MSSDEEVGNGHGAAAAAQGVTQPGRGESGVLAHGDPLQGGEILCQLLEGFLVGCSLDHFGHDQGKREDGVRGQGPPHGPPHGKSPPGAEELDQGEESTRIIPRPPSPGVTPPPRWKGPPFPPAGPHSRQRAQDLKVAGAVVIVFIGELVQEGIKSLAAELEKVGCRAMDLIPEPVGEAVHLALQVFMDPGELTDLDHQLPVSTANAAGAEGPGGLLGLTTEVARGWRELESRCAAGTFS